MTEKQNIVLGGNCNHDSAKAHVSGAANYIDDMAVPNGCLFIAFALSDVAYGRINTIDISKALQSDGVKSVFLAKDIAHLNIGAVIYDEPLLADKNVLFYGQALAVVLAESEIKARRAARLIKADITPLEAIVTVEQARQKNSFLMKPLLVKNGNATKALNVSQHCLSGSLTLGGQEHFYLESQAALAISGEKDEMVVHSSTQNPSEVQHLVAKVLSVAQHSVEIITRRMGGGFGGKETDSSQLACLCALFSRQYGVAVKGRLPRGHDFLMTGKRHDYVADYRVGFDEMGVVSGIEIDFFARCGYSLDLSKAIVARTLFHADNGYYFANAVFRGHLCKTNTASNTAFRGFGGPQGMLVIESVLQDIANYLKMDALLVRQNNFYQKTTRNQTPYGQIVSDNILTELTDELIDNAQYQKRRQAVQSFNEKNPYLKKGLAFSPVKFGISFTTTFLNQAGALVHIYQDGSIYLNHGGTEMGQGLFIKIAQVVANEFAVPLSFVKVSATSTAKVPNTSATAASSGSDMNGMAAQKACLRIKENLLNFASNHFAVKTSAVRFSDGHVIIGKKTLDFAAFIKLAYLNRVELFSNGFYKTPKIHYDEKTANGRPFYYYAYGVCLSEVVVDIVTGEYKLLAVDILHDVGQSLNPAIDKGQIVGGFIQGMGWLCQEELKWRDDGALLTTGPATYKIPSVSDTPKHFKVDIKCDHQNSEQTIFRSKAVGEPPLMLAIAVWLALKDAVFNYHQQTVHLAAPATFEQVFFALHPHLSKKT